MYLWDFAPSNKIQLKSLPYIGRIAVERHNDSSYIRNTQRHNSTICTFQYTLSGQGFLQKGNKTYKLPPGCGFLFSWGDEKVFYGIDQQPGSHWEFLYVEFGGGNIHQITRELVELNGPFFSVSRESAIIKQLISYKQFSGSSHVLSASESSNCIMSFFSGLAESLSLSPPPPNQEDILTSKALDFIHNHPETPINCADIADHLGVSREHISRCFSRKTGTSLYHYILEQKINYAKFLLETSSLSCKNISRKLGFSSPAHFAKCFYSLSKVTPGQWRRKKAL